MVCKPCPLACLLTSGNELGLEGGKALAAALEGGACPALTSLNLQCECCVLCVCVICACMVFVFAIGAAVEGMLHVEVG